jgi:quinol monooxygenase YgiN
MSTNSSSSLKLRVTSFLAVAALTLSGAAIAAGPVLRIVHFTALGAEQQQAATKLVDSDIAKAYHGAKGLKWVKFMVDHKTFETGSVSLWDDRADLEAFLKSDAYKGIPEKLKPLMKGSMTSDVFDVYEPRK